MLGAGLLQASCVLHEIAILPHRTSHISICFAAYVLLSLAQEAHHSKGRVHSLATTSQWPTSVPFEYCRGEICRAVAITWDETNWTEHLRSASQLANRIILQAPGPIAERRIKSLSRTIKCITDVLGYYPWICLPFPPYHHLYPPNRKHYINVWASWPYARVRPRWDEC